MHEWPREFQNFSWALGQKRTSKFQHFLPLEKLDAIVHDRLANCVSFCQSYFSGFSRDGDLFLHTSRKRGFHTPPLVPKIIEPRQKGSLVAVREETRDQLSGPSALGRQLADGRGFSPGWPGQPGLKVLRLARRPLVAVGQTNRD